MASVIASGLPRISPANQGITSPKNLALGGLAATSVVAGGLIGTAKGHGLIGLGVGAGIAAVALGAALIGNASHSYDDYPYVPDPGYYPGYDPGYNPGYDPGYNPGYNPGYDPGYERPYDPGGWENPGDSYGYPDVDSGRYPRGNSYGDD